MYGTTKLTKHCFFSPYFTLKLFPHNYILLVPSCDIGMEGRVASDFSVISFHYKENLNSIPSIKSMCGAKVGFAFAFRVVAF